MADLSNSTPVPDRTGTVPAAVPTRRAIFAAAAAAAVPLALITGAATAGTGATEVPELLAIGDDLDLLTRRHQAAVECLDHAEAVALDTCPPVPASMKPGPRNPDFMGSVRAELGAELDALGRPVGPFKVIRGQCYPIGTVASSTVIRKIVASAFDPETATKRMQPYLKRALTYEARREALIEASGLPEAVQELNAAAQAIWALVHRSKAIEARTPAGVLIKARVLQQAASTWDAHGGPHGRLVAAAGAEDLVASVVQVLGEAV